MYAGQTSCAGIAVPVNMPDPIRSRVLVQGIEEQAVRECPLGKNMVC